MKLNPTTESSRAPATEPRRHAQTPLCNRLDCVKTRRSKATLRTARRSTAEPKLWVNGGCRRALEVTNDRSDAAASRPRVPRHVRAGVLLIDHGGAGL